MESLTAIASRHRDLQTYTGWSAADVARVVQLGNWLAPHFPALIDDFYAEIQRHPAAAAVITGGAAQIARLEQSLHVWVNELFSGRYDEAYIERRWRVGLRHVEIGLPQVYTAAALSRLHAQMLAIIRRERFFAGDDDALAAHAASLGKRIDLDLAIIGDAYEREYVARQQAVERRRSDDILFREKELSSGLLNCAQAAVMILDPAGRIERGNPFSYRLLREERTGHDWCAAFLPAEAAMRVRGDLQAAAETAAATPITTTARIERDGEQRYLHWSLVWLRGSDGTPFGILAIGHDITDLHRAQQRALQAERLAAIGQMATGLAHESRNALQRIGASAEMLELELASNSAGLELIGRIQQAQAHLHQLLDEVRNYAAPIVLDRSECRLTEIWREAWSLLQPLREAKRAALREQIVAEDVVLHVDRFRLVQVFRNLLENALAASAVGQPVDVTCAPATLHGAPALAVHLRDYGAGLNAEQRRRIFDPFYTTKPTGTGLGTSIAQRFVEAHGGTLTVAECEAPGIELVITLPLAATEALPAT